jgi:hypothetical protein
MPTTESLIGSAAIAQSLLAAWNSGDVPRLRDELSQIAEADGSGLSVFEHERIEIVQGIAQTIRVWLSGARKKHADMNIALSLLRHLATRQDVAA